MSDDEAIVATPDWEEAASTATIIDIDEFEAALEEELAERAEKNGVTLAL